MNHHCNDDEMNPPSAEQAQEAVQTLLRYIGEDGSRSGLLDTPQRFIEALQECTSGYSIDARDIVGEALFQEEHDGKMVVVKDIPIYSLCEHHLLPFFGKAHIGYIPKNGVVVGLSKLARVALECFARRLQVQERLTTQIAEELRRLVPSDGCGVILECRHLCMEMRGVRSSCSSTLTSCMLGLFQDDETIRRDFESLVGFHRRTSCAPPLVSTTDYAATKCEECSNGFTTKMNYRIAHPGEDPTSDFLLYARCADEEYHAMEQLCRQSITGMDVTKLRLIDIGAGDGKFMVRLQKGGIRLSHYTAFEPNEKLACRLDSFLSNPDLPFATTYEIHRRTFDPQSVCEENLKGDIVLLSHSMYGHPDKEALVFRAMELVAEGGILLIFHRMGETVKKVMDAFDKTATLYAACSRSFRLNLQELAPVELTRLSAYTKRDLTAIEGRSSLFYVCMIAVEPESCNWNDLEITQQRIEKSRSKVSFAARSGKPFSVVQPNTGKYSF